MGYLALQFAPAESQVTFDKVSERPSITKKRQAGTKSTEACQMRHWGCGPYCHRKIIDHPDEAPPLYC